MKKYLRSNKTGVILPYSERILANKGVTVVTEQEAFPERFAPVELDKREKKVDLTIPKEVAVAPVEVSPELLAEASRDFGTPKATRVRRKEADTAESKRKISFLGLEGEF